jgi:hypothetical protein
MCQADLQIWRYRAPDVLGGAMMDGGATSPVESVPAPAVPAPAGRGPQPVRLLPVALDVPAAPVVVPAALVPPVAVPAAQGPIVPELLDPIVPELLDPIVPELLVAAGPVVPVPEGVVALGAVVVGDGDPTTPALLPLRPEAPTPAPVPGDAPGLPPVVCAMAGPDTPINSAAARGMILIVFMEDSHICDVG